MPACIRDCISHRTPSYQGQTVISPSLGSIPGVYVTCSLRFILLSWDLRFSSRGHMCCCHMAAMPFALSNCKEDQTVTVTIRGSFQKLDKLYVFSLKMNLFYKIHLQTFNVISIVIYHSGPTFRQVLYSCQDAFFVDVSDYSGHLIRYLLNASEAFPTEWFFFSILGTSQRLVGSCQECTVGVEALAIHTFPQFPILQLRHKASR